jgi:serine/threonine protein kinase
MSFNSDGQKSVFPQKMQDILIPETRESLLLRIKDEKAGDQARLPSDRSLPDQPPTFLPPSESPPNYEILAELGRSDNAVVYEAYDVALCRYVAVKVLNENVLDDRLQVESFWRKAQFLSQLDHKNFIKVLGVDSARGWIVMERMQASLHAKIGERPLASNLVLSILRQSLEGLTYLHGLGRLHGHLNPSNMLVNGNLELKFNNTPGYDVKSEFPCPRDGQKYIPPELLAPNVFGSPGPGIDLYCLGLSMLEMLMGPNFSKLFKGIPDEGAEVGMEWLRWHASPTECLPPIQKILPKIPENMVRVIEGLVKKNVYERYATTEEALADLEFKPPVCVDRGQSVVAPLPTTPPQRGAISLGTPPSFHEIANITEVAENSLSKLFVNLLRPWKGRNAKKSSAGQYMLMGVGAMAVFFMLLMFSSSEPKKMAAAPAELIMDIDSQPQGAFVQLDGNEIGTTPLNLSMTPGKHQISMELEGFNSIDKKFHLNANAANRRIYFKLKPREEMPKRPPSEPKIEKPPVDPPPSETHTPADGVAKAPETKHEDPPPANNPAPVAVTKEPEKKDVQPTRPKFTSLPTDLPDRFNSREKDKYFRELQNLMQRAWTADRLEALAMAQEAVEKMERISKYDARLEYAAALLYLKHNDAGKAVQYLDNAMKNTSYPLFTPWLQRICLYTQQKKYHQAAALCVELIDRSIYLRDMQDESDALYDSRWSKEAVEENLYFAAWIFGYIDFQCTKKPKGQSLWVEYDGLLNLTDSEWELFRKTRLRVKNYLGQKDLPAASAAGSEAADSQENLPPHLENAALPLEWQRVILNSTIPLQYRLSDSSPNSLVKKKSAKQVSLAAKN